MSNNFSNLYQKAIDLFDAYNKKDPNKVEVNGDFISQELLYSIRMTAKLYEYEASPTELMALAVRAQHIGRWEIKRDTFEMTKLGYFKWREALKIHHAKIVFNLLKEVGYEEVFIQELIVVLSKKNLKKDTQTQMLEDVICLVFLEHYFDAFALKHQDRDKLIVILKKTWVKMSVKAQNQAVSMKKSKLLGEILEAAL